MNLCIEPGRDDAEDQGAVWPRGEREGRGLRAWLEGQEVEELLPLRGEGGRPPEEQAPELRGGPRGGEGGKPRVELRGGGAGDTRRAPSEAEALPRPQGILRRALPVERVRAPRDPDPRPAQRVLLVQGSGEGTPLPAPPEGAGEARLRPRG